MYTIYIELWKYDLLRVTADDASDGDPTRDPIGPKSDALPTAPARYKKVLFDFLVTDFVLLR